MFGQARGGFVRGSSAGPSAGAAKGPGVESAPLADEDRPAGHTRDAGRRQCACLQGSVFVPRAGGPDCRLRAGSQASATDEGSLHDAFSPFYGSHCLFLPPSTLPFPLLRVHALDTRALFACSLA